MAAREVDAVVIPAKRLIELLSGLLPSTLVRVNGIDPPMRPFNRAIAIGNARIAFARFNPPARLCGCGRIGRYFRDTAEGGAWRCICGALL